MGWCLGVGGGFRKWAGLQPVGEVSNLLKGSSYSFNIGPSLPFYLPGLV